MILRQTSKILRNFARLIKPKISAHDNIFELMKDKSVQLKFINNFNNELLNTTKDITFAQMLNKNLNISQPKCEAVSNTVIKSMAYSPIWMKPYRISQKLNGQVKIQDNPNSVQIPYNPEQSHLKYHYSIDRPVRVMKQLQIKDKSTAYMFNLPQNITQNKIVMEIGYRLVKNVNIERCMLGLPAYAVIQFNNQAHLAGKFINKTNQIEVSGRVCHVVTHIDAFKLDLNRRQLVLKGLNQYQTPSQMLIKLSQFGKVMDLNLPMEIYRQPTLQQVKQLYKNEKNPICINYHRQNGTIESQYYPAFKQVKKQQSYLQNKEEQYKRRLRYCQNIDVYEGQQGKIKTKAKGFCIVTFSCQQQAQNCYLHLGKFMKIQLLNGKQQFQFDQKHRLALLRHVDNAYIERSLERGPYSDKIQLDKKKQKQIFQSLFINSIKNQYQYKNLKEEFKQISSSYISHINQLRQSIGLENIKNSQGEGVNLYGKSFDDLAEEQLYGAKLDRNRNNKRFKVNIDEYIKQRIQIVKQVKEVKVQQQIQQRQQRQFLEFTQQIRRDDQDVMDQLWSPEAKIIDDRVDQQTRRGRNQDNPGNKRFSKQKVKKRLSKLSGGGGGSQGATTNQPQKGKSNFSSNKSIDLDYRPKNQYQKVKSHMRYNKFVRDTINQYMGVFPIEKLQSQFYKKKPTFTNPQSLKFIDGTQFIEQQQVKTVLQFSTSPQQEFYDIFVKQNEIVKSLNLDVEELVLKNLQDNQAEMLQYYTDFGVIKKQFVYKGENIDEEVRNLNKQAQFGEQYRAIQSENGKKDKIVAISKLQSILPLDLVKKCQKGIKKLHQSQQYSQQKENIMKKYIDYFTNGQPIPDQLAQAFGLQKNSIIDFEQIANELFQQLRITKKDLQKLLNLKNYSEDQISTDVHKQLKIAKIREKISPKQASDYSKDPSNIRVKGKNQRSVVSKFRQI